MEKLSYVLQRISSAVWGGPVLVLMLFAGIYLSIIMRFPQLKIITIIKYLKSSDGSSKSGGISQFRTFSTALAATVGTGSIAGISAALYAGGAGAVFWLWVSAFFGMALSNAENILGVRYCKNSPLKGAMVYMEKGLGCKWLAMLFAFFCVLASLGMGCMAQSNSISSACRETFSVNITTTGIVLFIVSAFVISRHERLGKFIEKLVPIMSLFYISGAVYVILKNHQALPNAFSSIFSQAFSFRSAAGGFSGYFFTCVLTGLKRGSFSNEAGLGSTVAVHSSCRITDPEKQGAWGMTEVFIDTMIISTLTALVVLVSDVDITNGSDCICKAFSQGGLGNFGEKFIALSMIMFAFATIAGWFFIGEKACSYIFPKHIKIYKLIYLLCTFIGAVSAISVVWEISDIFNGLMAIPNLTALLILSSELKASKRKKMRQTQ